MRLCVYLNVLTTSFQRETSDEEVINYDETSDKLLKIRGH